jgi:hypothetical protein
MVQLRDSSNSGPECDFVKLAMRGIEVAAAALITVFGAMLLCGYLANERMIGL